uniref:Nucleotidyltransferase family protein n=1 Tax=Schlesneria paludicola TaxID=360056 RepID=A0A7C2K007_9PLAN
MKDLTDALYEFSDLFQRIGVPYVVMGGLAVRLYGLPRPTYDLDYTILLSRGQLPDLYDRAEELGYTVAPPYRAGWIDEVAGLPLVKFGLYVQGKIIDIDVFLAETDYQREVLARRRREEVEEHSVWVVSPEDLILLKALANPPRDRLDIGDVRFMQGNLDETYLRQWAGRLQIADRFEEIWRETAM